MSGRLAGKTAVIPRVAQGIGRGFALRFAALSAPVYLASDEASMITEQTLVVDGGLSYH